MKYALAVGLTAALLIPATSADAHAGVGPPPPDPSIQWCRDAAQVRGPALLIPGFGQAIAKCMEGHHMRHDVRNCLVATSVTLAGVALGAVIGGAAARTIAGDMIKVGTATCVALIVGT
jgi:hypothetical protein